MANSANKLLRAVKNCGMSDAVKVLALTLFAGIALSQYFDQPALSSGNSAAPSSEKIKLDIPPGIPADLWESLIPKDNPIIAEKVAPGEKPFFDKRFLSVC